VRKAVAGIEEEMGARFGDPHNPLLVSVRSGARVSMPGMMDTVLNLGLNDQTVQGMAARTGDRRFAYDSYRRFIQMYGNVVLGVEHHSFEEALDLHKQDRGVELDTQLTAEDWQKVIADYKQRIIRIAELFAHGGFDFREGFGDFALGLVGETTVELIVFFATRDGDREARRDRKTGRGHIGEALALAAKDEFALCFGSGGGVSFSLAFAKEEDAFGARGLAGGGFWGGFGDRFGLFGGFTGEGHGHSELPPK